MRQTIAAIRTIGRVTQGVRLVKLDEGTNIASITRNVGSIIRRLEFESSGPRNVKHSLNFCINLY